MASPKKTLLSVRGVAAGKEVIGIPTGDDLSALDRVKALFSRSMSDEIFQGWGASLMRHDMKLLSAKSSPGGTTFSFTVKPEHSNRLGNLHGGCCATLFDVCTTSALAPIAKPGFWVFAGVTRTLSVTYIRPVQVGETVLVESEVLHAGKRLCSIKGVMKRESDGAIMAICEHGKVSIDPEVSARI